MKYTILLSTILLFQGCLYFNDRGISTHLYDGCESYYDAYGNFIKRCDENLIDYTEIREGVVDIKDEIGKNLNSLTGDKQQSNCQKEIVESTTTSCH